ncbi:MAG TPA: NUDIX hydrolase [Pseudothermotoga sp.]|nr:NUDIX hydrolase [Pseudothermotoga sp.]HOK83299.1 NUDIX hydrolase [Pseudothermotoga sp.]HPP70124.1 NUDIX hydrolase [Pseudothermotoga sp.]
MRILSEKLLESQQIFKGKILTVKVDQVLLQNGYRSTREVVFHPGAVAVLPILQDGSVILVKQFRYPVGTELLEVPAGKLDENESPEECASRELEEETGFKALKMEYVGYIYTTPGFSNEKIYLYLAQDLVKTEQNLDQDEILKVEILRPSEVLVKCLDGQIVDAKTLSLVFLAKEKGVI